MRKSSCVETIGSVFGFLFCRDGLFLIDLRRLFLIHARVRQEYRMFLIVAMAVSLAGCTGCNSKVNAKDVMAKVNGYKILRSEVDKTYNSQIANSRQKPTAAEEEAAR